jgi:hypothetical protein
MTAEEKKFFDDITSAMQCAVDRELERKAKLGYKAVIQDKNGRMRVLTAKYIVRMCKKEKRSASAQL